MEDAGLREIVTALEARVARLEDQLAIHRLINSWGPAVDTGQAEAAAALFSDDAVLTSDMSHLVGLVEIEEMVRSDGQQALIRQGSAHFRPFLSWKSTATGRERLAIPGCTCTLTPATRCGACRPTTGTSAEPRMGGA